MRRWIGAVSLSLVASASVVATDLPVSKPDYHVTTRMEFITTFIYASVPPGAPLPHETESAEKAGDEAAKKYDERLADIAEKFDDGDMAEIYALKAYGQAKQQQNTAYDAAVEQHYEDPGGCLLGETRVTLASGARRTLAQLFDRGAPGRTPLARRGRDVVRTADGLGRALPVVTRGAFEGELVLVRTSRATLSLTPNHELVLAGGAVAEARAIGVGDRISRPDSPRERLERFAVVPFLTPDGRAELVTSVTRRPWRGFVYNLVLEDDRDGFVAEELAVLGLATARH